MLGLLTLTLPASVHAQASAGVSGVVKDSDGGVLPGVTVTARNEGTALTRATTSSGGGNFSITNLPPGKYTITAQLSSFADVSITGLQLVVGQTAPVSFTMKPASLEKTITVEGSRPLVQTSESSISNAISQETITSAPIADRNTITLALLAPGVTASPYFDPTKSRDNFDGFGFGGGSASSSWTLVDGGDNNDGVVGSILQFYPQDSIQEFEVITSRFKAQYGHTDGGVVNLITKSGSNTLSGGGYWLFRDKALNAKAFNEDEKPDFRQHVTGGLLGGPIVKDKAFFFGNADYTTRDRFQQTSGGGEIAQIDNQGDVPTPFKQTLAVGKVTANLNANNFLMGRYAYQDDSGDNANLGFNDAIEHGGALANKYHAFLVKDQMVIGSDKLNEAFFQFNRFRNTITSNAAGSTFDAKELIIDGTYQLGNNVNHPQATDQDKYQFVDNFSWRSTWKGDHDFKAGFEWIHTKLGGFFTLNRPFATFRWDTAAAFNAGAPADLVDVTNGPAFFIGSSHNDLLSGFIQDDWKPTQRLTLNLGLRYDVETNDWTQDTRTFVTADPVFFGGQPETDGNNFGPKVGFAYDVEGDGRFVVRGGYGLYYQQIFWNSPIRAQFLEGELQNTLSFEGAGVNFDPTNPFCANPDTPAAGCIPFPSVPAPNASAFIGSNGLTGVDPRLKTPTNHQFSGGLSVRVGDNWGIDADYVRAWSNSQIYRTRIAGRANINGLNTANQGPRARVNTGQEGLLAEQVYNGLLLSLRGNYKKVNTQLSYTFSRGQGHEDRQTDNVVVDNNTIWDDNYGPRTAQRDHVFAGSFVWSLPYEFEVGGILKFQSGFAHNGFDPLLGDVDGDLLATDSLADQALGSRVGDGTRNAFRGDAYSQVDVRFSKRFTLAGRYRPQVFFEVFNLFNTENQKPDDVVTNINNAAFGTSGTVAGQPRQAQISLRFDF